MSGATSFLEKLAKQKHSLGNAAMAASCFMLAARMVGQQKELRDMHEASEATQQSQLEEIRQLSERIQWLKEAVRGEINRGGKDLTGRVSALFDASPPAGSSEEGHQLEQDLKESTSSSKDKPSPTESSTQKKRFMV